MHSWLFSDRELHVRPLQGEDIDILWQWLNDPQVLSWYGGRDQTFSRNDIAAKYLPRRGDPITACLALQEHQALGYLQFYRLPTNTCALWKIPDDGTSWGIDLFIGRTNLWGQGLGTRLVTATCRYLLLTHQARVVTVDPMVDNKRAIRSYEKSGFQIATRLERHQNHEGAWRDSWLMTWRPHPSDINSH